MKEFTYKTKGTCSTRIHIKVDHDVLQKVRFENGCPGNTQGMARLVEGRKVEDVIHLLQGIQCQNGTSCPDQLAQALKSMK